MTIKTSSTSEQYDSAVSDCRDVFRKKTIDYGTAWRILRVSSLTDQIFIKAQRIRSIEVKGKQKIAEDTRGEFLGIVNYSVIALIQLELGETAPLNLNAEETLTYFEHHIIRAKSLMEDKNHDYGEAWRQMRTSSFTDLILMKILRIKQIEDNKGKTLISEGIDANYYDIINYAIFALIQTSKN